MSEKEVVCINPMSVAANREEKKRFCIDLSRWVNEFCGAKKFRIESMSDFQKVVKKVCWRFSFDLKSAFHQIQVRMTQDAVWLPGCFQDNNQITSCYSACLEEAIDASVCAYQ